MLARRAFFVLVLAFACAPSWCQTEITIGAGTGTMPYPFATSYQDARTQVIYLAGEIGSPYKLTALSLDVTTVPGQTLNDFTIRMKHTSLSAYPSPASWESSGWTTVYQANEMITSTGWRKFTFSTPFQYNGVDNLMVDFSFDNASSSTDGKCRYTAPGTMRTIYYRANGGYGDPLTWADSTPSSTRVNAIPNVKLEIGSVAMPTFSPDGAILDSAQNVTVSCVTPGATIHYTTNGIDPTETDPVVASGSTVLVDHTLTLKAKAWKAGFDPSVVKEASFRLTVVIFVKPDGNDANDGLTWATAKKTVQAGLNAAVASDRVWVKAGTYNERITLKAGVRLYGGFAGTETDLSQRDWTANRTVLDGSGLGSVVTSPSGATTSTRIDGFTIRNGIGKYKGSPGGGIYCDSSSPTIANNHITENLAYANGGGGVYCLSSSPVITNNAITGNVTSSYGGGIYCSSASPVISNNVIAGNGALEGGGTYCLSSSPTMTNNTIVANTSHFGGAVFLHSSSPVVSNNIVAVNSSGIYRYLGAPVLSNNCVYGNMGYDYSGVSRGIGDILEDPLLASKEYGNVHIQPSSPCRNAGLNGAPGLAGADMDGQARVQGGTVDIGADESDGASWPVGPYVVVRVTLSGNDANDGSAWDDAHAKRTVQAGVDSASAVGGDVWVKAGTYNQRVTLPAYVYLYGGFAGTEASRGERDWIANRTILTGADWGSVVTITGGFQLNAIDGFTIRGGSANYGGGIHCEYSSPAIANNLITGNTAFHGGGIYRDQYTSWPTIRNNIITGNSATWLGGGIHGSGTIVNNLIAGNNATQGGGGIYCADGLMVTGGAADTITNNTIVGNTAPSGGGIRSSYTFPPSPTYISNNIVAFNSSGICKTSTGAHVLRNNDMYGNTEYNYSGLTAGPGDISNDPLFVNRDGGNYHLLPGSWCIDRAMNDGAPSTDFDGAIRPQDGDGDGGAFCDIGAYEFPLSPWLAKKNYADGISLAFGAASVTAKFSSPGCVYLENLDRSSGVRVDTAETLSENALVNVQGTMQTDTTTGERYVLASSGWPKSSGGQKSLGALVVPGKSLGGGACGLQAGV